MADVTSFNNSFLAKCVFSDARKTRNKYSRFSHTICCQLLLGCLWHNPVLIRLGFSFWHKSHSGVFSACASSKSMRRIGQRTLAESTFRGFRAASEQLPRVIPGARSDSKLLAIYLRWKHRNANIRM